MRDALNALRPASPRHPFPEPRDDRPKGLNVLGTLAHNPELATAFHTFNGHVLFATELSQRQRELVVLRVAAVRGSAYEWAQHSVLAGDAGITPDEVARVREGASSPRWDREDETLLSAVDELLETSTLNDTTWERLGEFLDTRALMDLIFTVGAYTALAMMLGAFEVELDDDLT